MPHLNAAALKIDYHGCAFLRSVLSPGRSGPRNPNFLQAPAGPPLSIVAHLGRELRNAYAALVDEGVPEHLADLVEGYEAAMARPRLDDRIEPNVV